MVSLSLFLTILLLGIRHGFDLDHIAAISDVVSQTKNSKQAFLNGFAYILGHAAVVILLGFLVIILGINLPPWVDRFMGPMVGITLILLGSFIILNILVKKKEFKFVSRWMLIYKGFIHFYNHLFGDSHHHPIKYPQNFGVRGSYILGTIHGIGAETPTQVLLFISAVGAGGIWGVTFLLVFICGLLASNFILLILSLLGFIQAKRYKIYHLLGYLAGFISLLVGLMLMMGKI